MPRVKKSDWEVPAKVYCLRCKKATKNSGEPKIVVTKNKRVMVKVSCEKCDMTKCRILGMAK